MRPHSGHCSSVSVRLTAVVLGTQPEGVQLTRPHKQTLREILTRSQQFPVVVLHWPSRELWMVRSWNRERDQALAFRPGRIYEALDTELELDGKRDWVYRG